MKAACGAASDDNNPTPWPVPARGELNQRLTSMFRAEADFVWRVVRHLGVPEADAEDAVQEVFLVVAKRLDRYQERSALRGWLVAIARQVARNDWRTRSRHQRKLRELPVDQVAGDAHRAVESNEATAFVNDFLAGLEPDQAVVFYLTELEGLSAPEIAAALQVNLNTVYARLRLARQRFEARVQLRAKAGR